MEEIKCFVEHCSEELELICKCQYPPVYLCKMHKAQHLNQNGLHAIEKLQENHRVNLEAKALSLNDPIMTSQHYFIAPGTTIMNIFKFEISEIPLPKDYKATLNSMAQVLTGEILKVPRGETGKLKGECDAFVYSIKKIVSNMLLESYKLSKDICVIFNEMHSKFETETNRLLNEMIDSLLNDKIMKGTSGIIFKDTVEKSKQIFFSEIMLGEKSLEKIISKFLSCFDKFLPPQEFIIKYLSDFEARYKGYEKSVEIEYEKKLYKHIQSCYKQAKYQRVAIYKPAPMSEQYIQELRPEWIIVYNVLMKSEVIIVKQTVEIAENQILVLLYMSSLKMYDLVLITEYSARFIKRFNADELILASGSSLNSIIVIQNYPRKCYKLTLEGTILIEQSELNLTFETHYMILSALYIDEKKQIIFNTSNNYLYVKSLANDYDPQSIALPMNSKEQLISLKYKETRKLIIIRTTNYIHIYNSDFEELYRFRSNGQNFEISEVKTSNCIYFYTVQGKRLKFWTINFTPNDVKKLNYRLGESQGIFSTMSNILKNAFKSITAEENLDTKIPLSRFSLNHASILISISGNLYFQYYCQFCGPVVFWVLWIGSTDKTCLQQLSKPIEHEILFLEIFIRTLFT